MINLICGSKGSGKTKEIINRANTMEKDARGNIVFITDKSSYTYQISYKIRLINAKEYKINSDKQLIAFIKGLIAGNRDIEHFYIDGIHRVCDTEIANLEGLFDELDSLLENYKAKFTVAISMAVEELPEFLKKYL